MGSNSIQYSNLDLFILGFGGFFCIVWATGLAVPKTKNVHIFGVLFVLISGFRLSWEAFFLSGHALDAPIFYFIPLPFTYAIGPILYLYLSKLTRSDWKGKYVFVHFIPLLLMMNLWIALFFIDTEIMVQLISNLQNLSYTKRNLYDWLCTAIVIGPKISIFYYSMLIPNYYFKNRNTILESLPKELQIFSFGLIIYVWVMILADIFGYIFSIKSWYQYSAWSHSIVAILVYWFGRYRPETLLEYQAIIHKVRYAKSKVSGLAVNEIILNMNQLMTEEQFYADEDLRILRFAEELGISMHQLSEILNQNLNTNFNDFVNQHRVKAAQKYIFDEPNRSLLSIAMAVGFNSKSSFNRAFKKHTNMSPTEYKASLRE